MNKLTFERTIKYNKRGAVNWLGSYHSQCWSVEFRQLVCSAGECRRCWGCSPAKKWWYCQLWRCRSCQISDGTVDCLLWWCHELSHCNWNKILKPVIYKQSIKKKSQLKFRKKSCKSKQKEREKEWEKFTVGFMSGMCFNFFCRNRKNKKWLC